MHRIAIVRRENKPSPEWEAQIKHHGFATDQKKPDLVFSIGGDGTFLIAERRYPHIPKVLLRDSTICNRCYNGTPDELFQKLKTKDYTIDTYTKVEARIGKKQMLATNEISIRNRYPTTALRFHLQGNDLPPETQNELIGDGIVLATTFGAQGYFYSITKSTFTHGYGLAWNNLRIPLLPAFFSTVKLTFELTRGDAVLTVDNAEEIVHLTTGDRVHLVSSKEKARILTIPGY